MEAIIPAFEKVRDLLDETSQGGDAEIQFPQIVVIGSQSSGKSSVLESFVGERFLPRGSGCVTRCPIILRLVNIPKGREPWCVFGHRPEPEHSFTDFHDVEEEIIAQTKRLAGSNLGITNEPIRLTIYSPKVVTITVVDLPGFVQIPLREQPEDIEAQVKNLVKQYIEQKNSIILAVAPANADIATAVSIKEAKSVDENQERTILVLTKLDLADDLGKVSEVLRGEAVPMRLGIVGVINRSQSDIENNRDREEVLEFERDFLEENFPSIADSHGTPFLQQRLNRILQRHIAGACPELIVNLREKAGIRETELRDLGDDGDLCDSKKREVLVSVVDKFCNEYKGQVNGQSRSEISKFSLTNGTRISFILRDILNAELNLLEPFSNLTDEEILMTVSKALPVGHRMINPEVALDYFIAEEIKRILPVAQRITKCILQEMIAAIDNCLHANCRFPKINAAIYAIVTELLDERLKYTKEIMSTYFEVHSSSAWTSNPGYADIFKESLCSICTIDLGNLPMSLVCTTSNSDNFLLLSNASKCPVSGPTKLTSEQIELCKHLRNLSVNVFKIVRWQAQDYIAKAILSSLIYKTVDIVSTVLHTKLACPEKLELLVQEPDEINNKRVCLRRELQGYYEALDRLEQLMSEAM